MEAEEICNALSRVNENVKNAVSKARGHTTGRVDVVAVSKTKPVSMILDAYSHGQRHFGENYVTELAEKASETEILEMCPDIKWHFIGHLQKNKVNKLVAVKNLFVMQTIDSKELANALDRAWSKAKKSCALNVMIQVNTSGEKNKSGISPSGVNELSTHILENCSNLSLVGYMTIGTANYDTKLGPNPEFQKLVNYRDEACQRLNLDVKQMDLSMGMSHDYEHAIEMGSTCVRVGSSIFGSRNIKSVEPSVSQHS